MQHTLPTQLEVDGVRLDIRTDFRVALDIFAAFNDSTLTDNEKRQVLIEVLFINPLEITDVDEAIEKGMWFLACGEEHKDGPTLMSWEKDFSVIVAPINRTLGFDCRGRDVHWWTFFSAFKEIGECYFQNLVSIRYKRLKGKKLEKWEQEFYNSNREAIDISQYTEAEEELFRELGI